ncbi:MAG: C40 family peptidase [Caulobacteraceae bacterium]|nr:C40 family peptidase [Caulobacter sp.]
MRALAAARDWLGTPYRHGASAPGEGSDCLGLVRGVWRALYGAEPQPVPAYRSDWAEVSGDETLLEAARRWFRPTPLPAARPGDVLLFRMAPEACVKHCALLSETAGEGRVIHAYWGRAVVESWLGPWWRRRLHSAWSFPEIGDAEAPWPR